MIGNVTLFTVVLWLLIAFIFMDKLRFLAPLRKVILAQYQDIIIAYCLLLFLNIFGVLFVIYRKFFFKDTGKKLKHLEKQLDTEGTIFMTELYQNNK